MSKLNQIETQLKAIDQARFQRLCDAYLYRQGYQHINPIGLVLGSDKVAQGTPDTLVPLPNGGYVFMEYTTQQAGVSSKFQKDLRKCFDPSKTGIPVSEIVEIVLCHNTPMDVAEERVLAEICQSHGCRLTIIGIGRLAHDLYQKYPGLARDFLNVEVDTGQVVTPMEFIDAYQKSVLAAPLDTPFHAREQEMERVLAALDTSDLVIISGHAGVGKSRLALEACHTFAAAHPTTTVRCIFNRGAALFEDLRVHFSPPGHYLILVDDANRVSQIDYVLQLLHLQNEERRVKVVLTVRDYALDKVREIARPYAGGVEVELSPLGSEQITSLIHHTMGISDHELLWRINEIAQGNPRLAIMAARIAQGEGTLKSIADISALYDTYFRSVRQDFSELGDPQVLKVAGIVSFFRAVDRSNEKMMQAIASAFAIEPDVFWVSVRRLHELEVLDMYEDEVVRVSDQVLATYLFYLAVIKERALDISALLRHFHPDFHYRLIDSMNALYGAFDASTLSAVLRPRVSEAWRALLVAGNEASILQFIDVFCFLQTTEPLIYLRDRVADLAPEPVEPSKLVFRANGNSITSPSLLNTLRNMRYADEQTRPVTLRLLLDYAEKRPDELPQVLDLVIHDFCIRPRSHLHGFVVERGFMDMLWERACDGDHYLYTRVFLQMAATYLGSVFEAGVPDGPRSMAKRNFAVPATPELRSLRCEIWQRLFRLYQRPDLQEEILRLIRSQESYHGFNPQILRWDAEEVLPFMEDKLTPERFSHCLTVQDYLRRLTRYKIPFNEALLANFRSEAYQLSELLIDDQEKLITVGYEAYQQEKLDHLRAHFAWYRLEDYQRCFVHASEIIAVLDAHKASMFQHKIEIALRLLAALEPSLYIQVITSYLAAGDLLELPPRTIIANLIAICQADDAYQLLMRHGHRDQRRWLFSFFIELPPDQIVPRHLEQLIALYQQAELADLLRNLSYLSKYVPLDPQIVAKVTAILTVKAEADTAYGGALEELFNPYESMVADLYSYFAHEPNILNRAYLAAEKVGANSDNGVAFGVVAALDVGFVRDFTSWLCQRPPYVDYQGHERDYSVLWLRDDYQAHLLEIVEQVFFLVEQQQCWSCWEVLASFFKLSSNQPNHALISERQHLFLRSLIEQRHAEPAFMRLVFGIIGQLAAEERVPFVQVFLDHNQRFDDFEQLWLEPRMFSWSGSAIPMCQQRIDFYASLLPLMNTFDLLDHRQHIEAQIHDLHSRIEAEKKREFFRE